jgi:heme-degrading monooxygenase HmoA
LKSINAWKSQSEHREAQRAAVPILQRVQMRVCQVEYEYDFAK